MEGEGPVVDSVVGKAVFPRGGWNNRVPNGVNYNPVSITINYMCYGGHHILAATEGKISPSALREHYNSLSLLSG